MIFLPNFGGIALLFAAWLAIASLVASILLWMSQKMFVAPEHRQTFWQITLITPAGAISATFATFVAMHFSATTTVVVAIWLAALVLVHWVAWLTTIRAGTRVPNLRSLLCTIAAVVLVPLLGWVLLVR